jgi:hypothetical protein
MLKFALEDLTVEGLRKLADSYGIPKTKTGRDELLEALKERMAKDAEIVIGEPKKPWWKTASVIVSIIALVVSAAGWAVVYLTIQKDAAQKRETQKQHWQQVIIYKIIKDGTKKQPTMGFEDIRQKYLSEAAASNIVELTKEELQPHELDRILLELMASNMVYLNIDDNYTVQRTSTYKRADRVFIEEDAKYAILHELTINPGKHTAAELYQAIQKATSLTAEEYNALLNQLMASKMVIVGLDFKLSSITSTPQKKP